MKVVNKQQSRGVYSRLRGILLIYNSQREGGAAALRLTNVMDLPPPPLILVKPVCVIIWNVHWLHTCNNNSSETL